MFGFFAATGRAVRSGAGSGVGPARQKRLRLGTVHEAQLSGESVSSKLLLVVTSQLAVMLASGCDLCAGLDALAKQQAHPALKKILADLHERVKQGQSFSQALARHPDTFSDLYVTMVRAGESAGLVEAYAGGAADHDPEQHSHCEFDSRRVDVSGDPDVRGDRRRSS